MIQHDQNYGKKIASVQPDGVREIELVIFIPERDTLDLHETGVFFRGKKPVSISRYVGNTNLQWDCDEDEQVSSSSSSTSPIPVLRTPEHIGLG